MFGRKGQGAMEYLMTYGWAILVVMIVGVVMWQLGIFNMGGTTVTSTGFAKIKPQLAGTGLTRGGTLRIVFTNGVGTNIALTSVTIAPAGRALVAQRVDRPQSSCITVYGAAGGLGSYTGGDTKKAISPGNNFALNLAGCPQGTAGTVYNIRVSLPYIVTVGGISTAHTESGTLRGPFE
jgi:hypothetical protein